MMFRNFWTVLIGAVFIIPSNHIVTPHLSKISEKPIERVPIITVRKPPQPLPAIPLAEPIAIAQQPVKAPETTPQAVLNSNPGIDAVKASIVKWAAYYGYPSGHLMAIAECESGFSASVVNFNYSPDGIEHPSGVFQFLPSTFARYSSAAGMVGANIFNYEHNVQAAAYAFSHGGSGEWECK